MIDVSAAGAPAPARTFVPVPPTPSASEVPPAPEQDPAPQPSGDPAASLVADLADTAAARALSPAAVAAAGETPGQLVGGLLTAIETRSPLQSNTIRGVLILTIAGLAPTLCAKFGLAPPDLQDDVMAVSLLLTVWGAAQALYGRLTAKKPIG